MTAIEVPQAQIGPKSGRTISDTTQAVALVCGLLWIGGLGSLFAVLVSGMNLADTRRSGEAPSKVALVALVVGVIGVTFSLLAIMLVAGTTATRGG